MGSADRYRAVLTGGWLTAECDSHTYRLGNPAATGQHEAHAPAVTATSELGFDLWVAAAHRARLVVPTADMAASFTGGPNAGLPNNWVLLQANATSVPPNPPAGTAIRAHRKSLMAAHLGVGPTSVGGGAPPSPVGAPTGDWVRLHYPVSAHEAYADALVHGYGKLACPLSFTDSAAPGNHNDHDHPNMTSFSRIAAAVLVIGPVKRRWSGPWSC